MGHVTETSIKNFSAGDTAVGETETVQSLYVVLFTVVVVVVGGTVVVVDVVVVTTVSYAILNAVLAVFAFVAASVNTPAPTEIDAVPDALDVGVNVAVYVVPEPLKPDNDPPETVTSLATKFVEVSDNVNVKISVAPTPREPEPLRAIETVGGVVSVRVS